MHPFSFLPFKNLESQRLILRRITAADVNEIFALRSNTEVMKYVPRPLCTSLDEVMVLTACIHVSRGEIGLGWGREPDYPCNGPSGMGAFSVPVESRRQRWRRKCRLMKIM